jgi:hypothetical protein
MAKRTRRLAALRHPAAQPLISGIAAVCLGGWAGVLLSTSAPVRAAETVALEQSSTPSTCDTPQHHQLDFWVGDWQVFDADSNRLVAFDRVQKHSEGCIIQQNLTFLTDMYRRPGVKYRLAGTSINRFDGQRWVQMWADNQWGSILMYGSEGADGSMVFTTVTPSRNRDVKDVWEKRSDGSLRNLHYVAPAGSGQWKKYGDLIYRPNR